MPIFKDFRLWPEDVSRDIVVQYGFAVQLIAGADGQLTIAERELFYEDAKRRGIPDDVINEWTDYRWSKESLDAVVSGLKPQISRRLAKLLLFDSIRIAIEDASYPLEEQDAVRKAAEILDVDDKTVAELEIIASLDKNVSDLKRIAFFDAED